MYRVETDPARQLLSVTYTGHVDADQARQCQAEVERALATLEPGFRLLTDLSGLEQMEFSCAPSIRAVMDRCNERGAGLVVRVVPDPARDIGFRVMSYFHYDRSVPILTCETLAEARQALER